MNRFFNVRTIVLVGIMAAVSIVLGKLLAFNIGNSLRISFENLPIIITGFFFGPVVGAATALCADIVGCLLVGYAINPIITLGAVSIGVISGLFRKNPIAAVTLSHLVGSVIIKSVGLRVYYSSAWSYLAWRVPTYILIAAAETAIIIMLCKSRTFNNAVKEIKR